MIWGDHQDKNELGHLIQKFKLQDAINKSRKPRKKFLPIRRDLHNCTIKPVQGTLWKEERRLEQGARGREALGLLDCWYQGEMGLSLLDQIQKDPKHSHLNLILKVNTNVS